MSTIPLEWYLFGGPDGVLVSYEKPTLRNYIFQQAVLKKISQDRLFYTVKIAIKILITLAKITQFSLLLLVTGIYTFLLI